MNFVKPSHGDNVPEPEVSQPLLQIDFDSCPAEDCGLQQESLNKLLSCVQETLTKY